MGHGSRSTVSSWAGFGASTGTSCPDDGKAGSGWALRSPLVVWKQWHWALVSLDSSSSLGQGSALGQCEVGSGEAQDSPPGTPAKVWQVLQKVPSSWMGSLSVVSVFC